LNKIIKYDDIKDKNKNDENNIINNNNYIKKYGKIEYTIPEKITALDSEMDKI